ncbi:MAG: hypothetical protein ACK4IA_04635 [Paracoccus hibiscisoli]|uniref:hypothetical protein n=1 Tax=Paracoccus hibiscisoli TaxID=2023261 RepID=UPI00391C7899
MTLRAVTGAFGALDHDAQTGAGRFAERVGNEIGASTLPVAGALRFGERFVSAPGMGGAAHEGVRQLVEPLVRRPGAAVSTEMAAATAADLGAASANAAHDATTGGEGGTWWTDPLGGMGGLGVAALGDGWMRVFWRGASISRRSWTALFRTIGRARWTGHAIAVFGP